MQVPFITRLATLHAGKHGLCHGQHWSALVRWELFNGDSHGGYSIRFPAGNPHGNKMDVKKWAEFQWKSRMVVKPLKFGVQYLQTKPFFCIHRNGQKCPPDMLLVHRKPSLIEAFQVGPGCLTTKHGRKQPCQHKATPSCFVAGKCP